MSSHSRHTRSSDRAAEAWTRRQAALSLRWGTSDFEVHERERPGFRSAPASSTIKSPIDGTEVHFMSASTRRRRIFSTWAVTGLALACVAAFVWAVLWLRNSREAARFFSSSGSDDDADRGGGDDDGDGATRAGYVSSGVNAVGIFVINLAYTSLARRLTERENHRTATEHEDALILKLFCFQFINSFGSLLYIVFEVSKDMLSKDIFS